MANFARIKLMDVYRGFAMLFLIILHTGLHLWTGAETEQSGTEATDPFMSFLIFFVTIGGIYSAILGAVNAFMFYKRVDTEVNKPRQLVFSGLIACVLLISLNFLFRVFFSADSGMLYFALRTGTWPDLSEIYSYTILYNTKTIPNFWLVSSSSLTILGINSYLVPQILSIASSRFIKRGRRNWNSVYMVLFITGTIILLLAIPIRIFLAPFVESLLINGHPILAWPLALLAYDNFPIFPVSAFACYGAIVGIALARNESRRKIYAYTLSMLVIFTTLGLFGIIRRGGIHPGLIYDTIPIAIMDDYWRHLAQLGVCFLFFSMGLALFDFATPKWQKINMRNARFFARMGNLSMSIYIFEGMTAIALGLLLDQIPFITGWRDSLGGVIIIGAILALLWGLLNIGWEKIHYVGSLEWFVITFNGLISGKKSAKFDAKRKEVDLFQKA
ncbi:MAG: hypothetical protein JW776_13790 [Candidatus Lokiarchaeota archaeon]|nr:hypothetical protein [Candidatus Lokiarchaeota archaeon]